MEFKVLGPFEVCRDGAVVAMPGGKPRAVLAVLLLHANEPVSAERLAGALWGENAPAGAVRTVQVYVSRLRRALGDDELLVTTRAGYRLRVGPGELDLDRFERLLEQGRRELSDGRPRDAGELLREALALWRGPALADLAFEPFAQAEIARLDELRLAAVELRVEADLAAGLHGELVPELQRLVDEHPLRERLHGQLMLALYRSGRQANALEAYRQAREVLVEQLGIEPGADLRALQSAILAQDPGLSVDAPVRAEADAAAAGLESGSGRRLRVPVPPTTTVGRDADLARLRTVVGDAAGRLVTVVGPPGVGKTRLAIELARAIGPERRAGAVFVSLAALDGFEHVASTIARELDVGPLAGESIEAALARHLGGRELLLVLDNFEHVLEAAPLVAELVAAAPDVTVLATSREPLRMRAEHVFRLDPLALPAESGAAESIEDFGPAVELFVAIARARDPSFSVGERNMSAVVEVCRRLDGLPLAIELAACRVGLLSVSELAALLRSGLGTLGAAPRDAPRRQRTLTATLEWSFALLAPPEQSAFVALAVFAGGCTIDAAQTVTRAPLEVLEALVAKNLVLAQSAPDRSSRMGMLETVRDLARARLAQRPDRDAVHRRHCEYYLALAERTRPEVRRSASPAMQERLDLEIHNIRAGLTWSSERPDPTAALRLASALWPYWGLRNLASEAAAWLDAALALPGKAVPVPVRAAALEAHAYSLVEASNAGRAEAAALESLELRRSLGDRGGYAASLCALANARMHLFRPDDAYRDASEAERLARESEDELSRVWALHLMAMGAPTLERALSLGKQAAAKYDAMGNRREVSALQTNLAYTAMLHGDDDLARRLSLEALEIAETLGDPMALSFAHGNVGLAALFTGDTERARTAFVRQLGVISRAAFYVLLFEALDGLAAVAATHGRDVIAATLNGAAEAANVERHDPIIARRLQERFFAPARARLGAQPWREAHAAGASLDRDQAIEAALQSLELRAVA